MAKIVRLFIFTFLFLGAAYANDAKFNKFDTTFDNAAKKEKISMHQELKTLYVKSIMENNINLRIKSLERLIKSSRVLGLDTKSYEKELSGIKPKEEKKPAKKETAKKEPTKSEPVKLKPEPKQEKAQEPPKLKQLSAPPLKSKNSESVKSSVLKLLEAVRNDDKFELKFSRPLNGNDIQKTELNDKKLFRTIYDFKGIWSVGSVQSHRGFLVDEIRISQFNADTIRVVFVSKFEQNLKLRVDNQSLVFTKASPTKISDVTNKKPQAKNPKTEQTQPAKTEQKQSAKVEQNPQKTQKSLPADPKKNQEAIDIVIGKKAPPLPKTQTKTEEKAPVKIAKKPASTKGKVIVLDAGHGGDDPGAINGKLKEKDVVLDIALKAGKELKERGYKVYYTRSKDKFINLRDRTKFANDKAADLFISIHANAAPNKKKAESMQGIETFFLSPARSERSKNAAALENKSDIEEMNFFSKQTFLNFLNREKIIASNKLAIDVQREVLANAKKINSKASDGGVREAPFWVLVGALMPAVLLEVGYITHPDEGALIAKSKYQDAIAKGLADGIDVYFSNQK